MTKNPGRAPHVTPGRMAPGAELMVEPGTAFMRMAGMEASAAPRNASGRPAGVARADATNGAGDGRYDVIVVGAGQAGLSVGYHLRRLGLSFVILEANERVGDTWRRRWDSLRLFTPAGFDGLDGLPFPARSDAFPTKDEMADFLEGYAAHFELPVVTGARVERLAHEGGRYVVHTARGRFEGDQVVVAMANYQAPRVPPFAGALDPSIVQIHSVDYRNPEQLGPGAVLIVGAGNSGSEIAVELSRQGRDVWMSGRDTGHVPFRIEGFAGRHLLVRLVLRGIFHHVLTLDTPLGRKVRPQMVSQGGPLIRVKPRDLAALGVRRVPRVAGVRHGRPVLEDGSEPAVSNVIWCTGFHPNFGWIDLPVFDDHGEPRHDRGVVTEAPGLYFVGLHFLYAMSSTMIHGVGRDAHRIAGHVAARARARAA